MIHYFFYKNIIFTLPRFVFGFYTMFSGQRIFDDVYVALYNAVFTAVPVVVRAVLEQDVNYVFPVLSKKNGELFL
jgi:magnesium-transporting ATPase (P-type)